MGLPFQKVCSVTLFQPESNFESAWDQAMLGMRVGGERTIIVPSSVVNINDWAKVEFWDQIGYKSGFTIHIRKSRYLNPFQCLIMGKRLQIARV